ASPGRCDRDRGRAGGGAQAALLRLHRRRVARRDHHQPAPALGLLRRRASRLRANARGSDPGAAGLQVRPAGLPLSRGALRMAMGARRVLVVAHRTARDPALVDAVAERAPKSPAEFTLLVPAVAHGLHRLAGPEDHCGEAAEGVLRAAIPVLSKAAGTRVSGRIGSHDPFAAVWDGLNHGGFDEVIVSTHPSRISQWLHL